MAKHRIYVGLPSMGWSSSAQGHTLRKLEKKYADTVELVYPDKLCYRVMHDFARNSIVDEFLASDCDILWQLDADVAPPDNVLDIVVNHADLWQAAGCPYPVMMGAGGEGREILWTVYNGETGKGLIPSDIPMSGQAWVDGMATGCMFLKRGVFARLQKPYFEFKYNPEMRNLVEGEDLGFCLKLKALGIPFFVDYSLVCGHTKEVDLLEINNYAMRYAKRCIETYSAQVREELKQHAAKTAAARKPQSTLWVPK